MAYSPERRAAVLKKLEPPNAVPLRQLAKEEGISEATLHSWRREACVSAWNRNPLGGVIGVQKGPL